ncbi:hypothetical protein BVY01_05115 [bacterium I07]|nr:hypothetical protein BVY01_05115 [bacterium I07]
MTEQEPGVYTTTIPPQSDATVQYFIIARTQNGIYLPIQSHSYSVGRDILPPVLNIIENIPNTISNAGPFHILINPSDNGNVDPGSGRLQYWNQSGILNSIRLSYSHETGYLEGEIPGPFAFGDTVVYQAIVSDSATIPNQGESEELSFIIGRDGFEGGLRNWDVDDDGWGLVEVKRSSGDYSVNESPGALYQSEMNTSITTALPLDFSNVEHATLSFMEQHFFSAGQNDFGVVEISSDNSQSWIQVSEEFRDSDELWNERFYSLDEFTGEAFKTVLLRFRTQTDSLIDPARQGWFVDEVKITTGSSVSVEERKAPSLFPERLSIQQNYPNPFNPETTIAYSLPAASKIKLIVFDIYGQEVRTLVNEEKSAGHHSVKWNGLDDSDNQKASGIYLYRIEADHFTMTRKMLLVK